MKRYVRTFTNIYDTYEIRKNSSCFDKGYDTEGYYDCNGHLVAITMWGCDPVEYKASHLGFIISQSDNFEDLLTDKDFIRGDYVYIENGNDFKRVAYRKKGEFIVLWD